MPMPFQTASVLKRLATILNTYISGSPTSSLKTELSMTVEESRRPTDFAVLCRQLRENNTDATRAEQMDEDAFGHCVQRLI